MTGFVRLAVHRPVSFAREAPGLCGAPSTPTRQAWNGVWIIGRFSYRLDGVTCGVCRRILMAKGEREGKRQRELFA